MLFAVMSMGMSGVASYGVSLESTIFQTGAMHLLQQAANDYQILPEGGKCPNMLPLNI